MTVMGPSVELNWLTPLIEHYGRKNIHRRTQIISTRFSFSCDKIHKLTLKHNYDEVVEDYGFFFVQNQCLWKAHWKNRLLILKGDHVFLFKTKKGFEKQWIDKMQIDENVGIYLERSESKHKDTEYHIRLVKGWKTYHLSTNSEEERDSWIASLLTVISRKLVENSSSTPNTSSIAPNSPSAEAQDDCISICNYNTSIRTRKIESSDDISESRVNYPRKISNSTRQRPQRPSRFSVDNLFDSRTGSCSSALVTRMSDSGKVTVFDIYTQS